MRQPEQDDDPRRSRGNAIVLVATIAWAAGISAGLYGLWSYAHDPGLAQASPARWPVGSGMRPPTDRPVLLLFAHPRCPCTRASRRELARLTARLPGKVETRVVFVDESKMGQPSSWNNLWSSAEAVAEARVSRDPDGVERELFRARTSGLALLYSNTGTLLFQGGITASRGHEGGSVGIAALEALLMNRSSQTRRTPVYGCPLQTPGNQG